MRRRCLCRCRNCSPKPAPQSPWFWPKPPPAREPWPPACAWTSQRPLSPLAFTTASRFSPTSIARPNRPPRTKGSPGLVDAVYPASSESRPRGRNGTRGTPNSLWGFAAPPATVPCRCGPATGRSACYTASAYGPAVSVPIRCNYSISSPISWGRRSPTASCSAGSAPPTRCCGRRSTSWCRRRRCAVLGELAGGMAHEFNNTLCGALGFLELTLAVTDCPPPCAATSSGCICCLDAAQTVSRVQDFARRRCDGSIHLLDLDALVRQTIEVTRHKWESLDHARGTPIHVAVHTDAKAHVNGSPNELARGAHEPGVQCGGRHAGGRHVDRAALCRVRDRRSSSP